MQFSDNFTYVILVGEHEFLHTTDHPFCWNSTCECHDDQDAIAAVQQYVVDGLLTPDEATDFMKGNGIMRILGDRRITGTGAKAFRHKAKRYKTHHDTVAVPDGTYQAIISVE
jgi:hypothetical protein